MIVSIRYVTDHVHSLTDHEQGRYYRRKSPDDRTHLVAHEKPRDLLLRSVSIPWTTFC